MFKNWGGSAQFFGQPVLWPGRVGGLYVKQATSLWPLLDGGVQENNKRAGTEKSNRDYRNGGGSRTGGSTNGARMKRTLRLKSRLIQG
jgi:cysteine desulfurase